jgi:hypothetical protein
MLRRIAAPESEKNQEVANGAVRRAASVLAADFARQAGQDCDESVVR